MSTIFDSAQVVKSRTFGRGVLASRPVFRTPYTASDYDAYVEMMAAEPNWDALAAEAAAQDAYENGVCC